MGYIFICDKNSGKHQKGKFLFIFRPYKNHHYLCCLILNIYKIVSPPLYFEFNNSLYKYLIKIITPPNVFHTLNICFKNNLINIDLKIKKIRNDLKIKK